MLVLEAKDTAEGKDILEQLRKLCPEGDFVVDENGEITSKNPDFCMQAGDEKRVKHPAACSCICQLIMSKNTWKLRGVKMFYDDVESGRHWPHTTPDDEKAGSMQPSSMQPNGKPGSGTGGTIEAPTTDSEVEFDTYDPQGSDQPIPYHKVLGHELCGHAKYFDNGTHDPRPQVRGDRPGHNQAIDEENILRIEEEMTTMRGRYNNPKRGESTAHKRKTK